jgi:hypothetical protein
MSPEFGEGARAHWRRGFPWLRGGVEVCKFHCMEQREDPKLLKRGFFNGEGKRGAMATLGGGGGAP